MDIFNKKLVKIGESYCFIVDIAYIRNGQLNPDKKYDIDIREVDEREVDEVENS